MYIYNTDMSTPRHQLETTSLQLRQLLLTLGPWLEGTLVATTRRCGKRTCRCHRGAGHPVLYVTWKENGQTVSLYVPRAREDEVRAWVDNYRKLKALIRQVSVVQRQLVRLRGE